MLLACPRAILSSQGTFQGQQFLRGFAQRSGISHLFCPLLVHIGKDRRLGLSKLLCGCFSSLDGGSNFTASLDDCFICQLRGLGFCLRSFRSLVAFCSFCVTEVTR